MGNFSRGLWYFVLFVATAGVLAGIAGLGIGFILGWVWEQLHRRRRSMRLKSGTMGKVVETGQTDASIEGIATAPKQPRLRLVSMDKSSTSHVVGSRLTSVKFREKTVELDFSGVVIETEGQPVVSAGPLRYRYPDEGSRDALCRLIGATVRRMRISESKEVQLTLDDGSELILHPRVLARGD